MRQPLQQIAFASLAALSLSIAGCTTDDTGASSAGPPLKPTEAHYDAGPFTVDPGQELVMCTYVRGENAEDEDVVRFDSEQSKGGHHLIVYTIDHQVDLPPSLCSQGGQPSWSQLLASQIEKDTESFPAGVGFHVKAHQQYVMETHYINTTSQPLTVNSSFKETYADPGTVTQRAATYFFGTTNIDLQPNAALTKSVTCKPPAPMSLQTMFGHEHRRGTGVTVDLLSGVDATPSRLYETKQWDGPPIKTFDGGRMLGASDAVKVTCDWQNDGPTSLGYPHEMCFAIGYYWPADSGIMCISGGGKDDCVCQPQGALDTGPGGATVKVELSRATDIPGAKGDLGAGAPLYCSLFREEDWDAFQPKPGASPFYFRDQIDVPLAQASDTATFEIDDVTPGAYKVLCMMDAARGGFYIGSGDVVNSSAPNVTAVAGKTVTTKAELDFMVP